ncbi:MAG: 4Fe-4S dicluster domain-containing protein [Deltaproteobacteria bacterium]|nr:4Fe-4S dicluster domain-containing protein [Deltaproteobacteria bacterium]
MKRRTFLSFVGLAGGTALASKLASARPSTGEAAPDPEMNGILIDTTRCEGCHTCEEVCAEARGFPEPDLSDEALASVRDTTTKSLTVVNTFEVDGEEIYVKRGCMHCSQPACTSACLVNAMHKDPTGPVTWDSRKCMGCRFCMISCPFDVPKFEYDEAVPKILKCTMCLDRQQAGEVPTCVENCPGEALKFGKRRELLEEARRRIYGSPKGTYFPHIYGEHEAGGTGVLYLSAVPFEKLGFPTRIGNEAYPGYSRGFLYSVPFIFMVWPLAQLGFRQAAVAREEEQE